MGIRWVTNTKRGTPIKAKDSPWDAVLMGSVASTVDANIRKFKNSVTVLCLKKPDLE